MLILTTPPDLPGPVWETQPGLINSQLAGRSWWAIRYTDGTIINEWDRDPGSPNGHADWGRIRYTGMQRVRLYCPSGHYAELGGSTDQGGRFFQFKVGLQAAGLGDATLAQLIGVLGHGNNGEAFCYAWETAPWPELGHLNGPFADNVLTMAYHQLGMLAIDALGLKL